MSEKLGRLQNQVMRIILRVDRRACSQDMHNKLGLLTLYNCKRFLLFQLIFKIVNVACPEPLVAYSFKQAYTDILMIGCNFIYLNPLLVRICFSSLQQGIGTVFPKNSGKLIHRTFLRPQFLSICRTWMSLTIVVV